MGNRVYSAELEDNDIVCVAPSVKSARRLFWANDMVRRKCENKLKNLRVIWNRNQDAKDFPVGIPSNIEGLQWGLYSYIEEDECPECGYVGRLIYDGERGEVLCNLCVEYLEEEAQKLADEAKDEEENEESELAYETW